MLFIERLDGGYFIIQVRNNGDLDEGVCSEDGEKATGSRCISEVAEIT